MRGSQLNSTRVSHGSHAVPPEQYASLTWVPRGSLMNSTWAPHGAMADGSQELPKSWPVSICINARSPSANFFRPEKLSALLHHYYEGRY